MKLLSRKVFLEKGVEIIDNIIDARLFRQIEHEVFSAILAILDPSGDDHPNCDSLIKAMELCNDLDPCSRSLIYGRLQQLPSLLSVPSTSPIINLAAKLLDQEPQYIGVWPRVQLRFDLPFVEETEILWHTDYLYNGGTKNSLTFWIPLTDYYPEMGGICYIPGSHRLIDDFTFQPNPTSRSKHNYDLSPEQLTNKTILNVEGKANQGVLFDSQLIHSGILNRGSLPRATILFRMQDLKTLERN